MTTTKNVLHHHYRCPEELTLSVRRDGHSHGPGFFRLGPDTIAYGRLRSADSSLPRPSPLLSSAPQICDEACSGGLPFDPEEVLDNLRFERYVGVDREANGAGTLVRTTYYMVRPLLPVFVRKHLQRIHLRGWDQIPFPHWPLDCSVEAFVEHLLSVALNVRGAKTVPFIWFWPEGHAAAAIMTHDVETAAGRDFSTTLLALDKRYGVRPSFQLIPERRYDVPVSLIGTLRDGGAEVNIHDLQHDGQLYKDREEFLRRAARINSYVQEYGAKGFRAGVLYRNLNWYDSFEFSYDLSVPNVAHLDPQRGGCCTVFPFFVGRILELPLTMAQDYTLFHILGRYSTELWKAQTAEVLARHGLMSFNVHPDYVIERRARTVYEHLLDHLTQLRQEANVWMALPGEVDQWWRARQQMHLVQDGTSWRIEGPESDRASLAYACLDGNRLTYRLQSGSAAVTF